MFDMLEPLSSIRREISRCIVSEEEIADDASPALASVRRKMKQAQNDIHDAMASRLNSYRDYLTDAIITQRDGRYCLPVKAEYKSKVPGMVHDASSTGLTLFIEPMAVVSLNNKLRELAVEEKKEIDQVLMNLSQQLMPYIDVLSDNAKILEKLDMIFAKALFAGELNAVRPVFSKDRSIDLKEARHPLIEKDQVVPIDVRLGHDFDQLIITGPNTGGKTVSLKTTGLLTLMGQAGLHIPAAEGSVLGVFEDVYADIGDEQSIEQSLSTFSAHMKNIVHILKRRTRIPCVSSMSWGRARIRRRARPWALPSLASSTICRPAPWPPPTTVRSSCTRWRRQAWKMPAASLTCRHSGPPTGCSSAFPASPTPLPSAGASACPSTLSTMRIGIVQRKRKTARTLSAS
jgi:DNA mismatch repair protein MutS2